MKQSSTNKLIYSFLILIFSLTSMQEAQASHFRYANITWEEVGTNQVEFTVQQAWRRTFGPFAPLPIVGRVVNTSELFFGDGNSVPIDLVVSSINVTEDWFFGEFTVTHTYDTPGDYLAFFQSFARISTLANNADGDYRVESLVNVGGNNNPPKIIAPVIINIQEGLSQATFQFQANDEDGDDLEFRLATSFEASGSNFGYVHPVGAAITTDGLYTFNSDAYSNNQLLTTSVVVEDLDNAGNVKAKSVVDLLIKITGVTTPPAFTSPTPANGATLDVEAGQEITFTVTADDATLPGNPGGNITLSATGVPLGASFSPNLPTAPSNPVTTNFSWTPTTADLGLTTIQFIAEDDLGGQATTQVNVNVTEDPIVTPPTGSCNIGFTTDGLNVTVTGLTDAHVSLKLHDVDAGWSIVYQCFDNCDNPQTVTLPEGRYYLNARMWNANWDVSCEETALFELGPNLCGNITYAGTIAADESFEDPYDPAPIVNMEAPSGGTGAIEYLWLASTSGCPGAGDEVPNSNSSEYDPGPITQTTYYMRCSRTVGCTIYYESNCIVKEVTGFSPDCNIAHTYGPDFITVSGLDGAHMDLKIFDSSWSLVSQCFDDCGAMETVSNLSNGTYYINAKLWDANWNVTCEYGEYVTIDGTFALIGQNGDDAEADFEIDIPKVNVYPNPAANEVFLRLDEHIGQSAEIGIYNSLGELMLTRRIAALPGDAIRLETSDFKGGVYLMSIQVEGEKRLSSLFVISRL